MQAIGRVVAFAIAALVLTACSAGGGRVGLVKSFGTYRLNEATELRVYTRGMSLVQYELTHPLSGELLLSDGFGRGFRGWFLYYDEEGNLWAHGHDSGTVVWTSRDGRHFRRLTVEPHGALARRLPREVLENLSDSERRVLGVSRLTDAD